MHLKHLVQQKTSIYLILKKLKGNHKRDYYRLRIKKSLWEHYENIKDKKIMENFEKKEKNIKVKCVSIDEIIK